MFYTDAKQRAPLAEYDHSLVWTAVLLLGLGLVMVYSASIAIAEGSRTTGYQPAYYLARQSLFVAAGVAAGVVAFQIPLAIVAAGGALSLCARRGAIDTCAGARCRARSERQPALDLAAIS